MDSLRRSSFPFIKARREYSPASAGQHRIEGGVQDPLQVHRTTVALKLNDILAREGVRALEAKHQGLVQTLALQVA